MNILIVVGARPNFMKAAPIISAIRQHNQRLSALVADRHRWPIEAIRYVLVHTGQHYDDRMSDAFFRDLDLPQPDVHLGVGSGSHAVQTAEVMRKFEQVLLAEKPDVVVLVGDVNSTVACALVTAKISFDVAGSRPLIAHVEAGLRSFDRSMPEEINRLLTDQVSDLLFVTEEGAIQNLRDEGVPPYKIHFVGNTMIDSLLAFSDKAETSSILHNMGLYGGPGVCPAGAALMGGTSESQAENVGGVGKQIRPYALLTLHRPSNVDNRATILDIMEGLEELATTQPIIFPVHPRTRQRLEEFGVRCNTMIGRTGLNPVGPAPEAPLNGILLTEPLGYVDFLCLMKHARIVVTDSGGIQEETTGLGVPCVTVRNNTERPVTIEKGTNILAGTRSERIKNAIRQQMARKSLHQRLPEKWDGQAATRIVATLIQVQTQADEHLSVQTATV
jgi:UDP-N-acetylglucosamine 2-epimerase (non-hydrolysing)